MNPEETIRRALEAEASTVEVRPDALAAIRARTRRRRSRGWVVWGAGLAAAAAAAVTILVLPDAPQPEPPRPAAPTVAVTPSPVATGPLVAVYYVGPGRDRALVREFHRVAPGSDAVRAALGLMFGTAPLDPDYASAWPRGTTVRGVTVAGDVVTVDLGGATPPSAIAAQQLVWTVTAASGLPGVRIGPGGDVLRRAPAVDTLASVWLINPQEGDVVRGGRVYVHVAGFGSSARLTVVPGGVGQDLTLRGGSPAQREAHLTLSLPPGTYTLTVTLDGVSDDHTVVVE
ncbi:GerMN domain-containing protein [Asanoa sp. NPDC049518]|uniref:GerMN domain-containing protein n=1 Tax=unclassified Asanoa TaxID=2685164 RepID=UPI00344AA938